jgi:hypothetical protein
MALHGVTYIFRLSCGNIAVSGCKIWMLHALTRYTKAVIYNKKNDHMMGTMITIVYGSILRQLLYIREKSLSHKTKQPLLDLEMLISFIKL